MNCIVISSSTLVVAVFIPGGSLAALPNFFHFYERDFDEEKFFGSTTYFAFGNDRQDFQFLVLVGLGRLEPTGFVDFDEKRRELTLKMTPFSSRYSIRIVLPSLVSWTSFAGTERDDSQTGGPFPTRLTSFVFDLVMPISFSRHFFDLKCRDVFLPSFSTRVFRKIHSVFR